MNDIVNRARDLALALAQDKQRGVLVTPGQWGTVFHLELEAREGTAKAVRWPARADWRRIRLAVNERLGPERFHRRAGKVSASVPLDIREHGI